MNENYIFSIDVGNTYIKFAVYDRNLAFGDEIDKIITYPVTRNMANHNGPCNINISSDEHHSMRIGEVCFGSNEYPVSDIKKQLRKYNYVYHISFPPRYEQHLDANVCQILSSAFKHISDKFCEDMGITESNDKIFRTILTVPAIFSEHQKNNILLAAENADLLVEREYIVSEPFGGLFSFWKSDIINIRQNESQTVLVFDLGGGTLDLTVFDIMREGNTISVNELGSGGISFGGNDIDRFIYERYILSEHEDTIRIRTNSAFRSRFLNNAVFSDEQRQPDHPIYKINYDNIVKEINYNIMLDIRKYKEQICTSVNMDSHPNRTVFSVINGFAELELCYNDIVDLLDSATLPIQQIKDVLTRIFDNINRNPANLNKVFMVGGSSNIKYFQNLISDTLGVSEDIFIYSNEMLFSVSKGALCYRILSDTSINTQYNLTVTSENNYMPFEIGIIKEEENGNQIYERLMSSVHPVEMYTTPRNNVKLTVNNNKCRLNLYRMSPDFPSCNSDEERYSFGLQYADIAIYLGYFEFDYNNCDTYTVKLKCYLDGRIEGTFLPNNNEPSFTLELITN